MFAAAEHLGIRIFAVADVEPGQQFARATTAILLAAELAGDLDIFDGVEKRREVGFLKHEAEMPASQLREVFKGDAVFDDRASFKKHLAGFGG